jgi:hypothetical protein
VRALDTRNLLYWLTLEKHSFLYLSTYALGDFILIQYISCPANKKVTPPLSHSLFIPHTLSPSCGAYSMLAHRYRFPAQVDGVASSGVSYGELLSTTSAWRPTWAGSFVPSSSLPIVHDPSLRLPLVPGASDADVYQSRRGPPAHWLRTALIRQNQFTPIITHQPCAPAGPAPRMVVRPNGFAGSFVPSSSLPIVHDPSLRLPLVPGASDADVYQSLVHLMHQGHGQEGSQHPQLQQEKQLLGSPAVVHCPLSDSLAGWEPGWEDWFRILRAESNAFRSSAAAELSATKEKAQQDISTRDGTIAERDMKIEELKAHIAALDGNFASAHGEGLGPILKLIGCSGGSAGVGSSHTSEVSVADTRDAAESLSLWASRQDEAVFQVRALSGPATSPKTSSTDNETEPLSNPSVDLYGQDTPTLVDGDRYEGALPTQGVLTMQGRRRFAATHSKNGKYMQKGATKHEVEAGAGTGGWGGDGGVAVAAVRRSYKARGDSGETRGQLSAYTDAELRNLYWLAEKRRRRG